MTRRKKVLSVVLLIVIAALSTLAYKLSHNLPCTPSPKLGEGADGMKAVVYRCYGPADVLTVEEVEKPAPEQDRVLVKVQAASVNPLDWHYMRGSPYFMRLQTGLGAPANTRLGVDFAGIIVAVGDNVTNFKVGDRVFGGANGAFAEYVTVREAGSLALIPDNISFEQAASVGIAGITALQALRDKGQLGPGQKVLINGASGGVGTFAVQVAKSLGAQVSGVCSTRNLEMVKSLGADHVIDYTREDYTHSGILYDLIIDNVGNHSLLENRQALKPDGRLVIIGGPKGNWVGPLSGPISAMILSPFVDQEFLLLMAQMNGKDLRTLGGLMEAGSLRPQIDRTYPLSEAAAAIRYSEEGHARGKIVLTVN